MGRLLLFLVLCLGMTLKVGNTFRKSEASIDNPAIKRGHHCQYIVIFAVRFNFY